MEQFGKYAEAACHYQEINNFNRGLLMEGSRIDDEQGEGNGGRTTVTNCTRTNHVKRGAGKENNQISSNEVEVKELAMEVDEITSVWQDTRK